MFTIYSLISFHNRQNFYSENQWKNIMNVSRRIYKEHGLTDINRGAMRHSFSIVSNFEKNCRQELNLRASPITIILFTCSITILILMGSNVLTQILSRHIGTPTCQLSSPVDTLELDSSIFTTNLWVSYTFYRLIRLFTG